MANEVMAILYQIVSYPSDHYFPGICELGRLISSMCVAFRICAVAFPAEFYHVLWRFSLRAPQE